jgi:lactam utilization protein B
MDKLQELYEKAESDEALKAALIKAQEDYAAKKAALKKNLCTQIIDAAKKQGINLSESDFAFKKAALNDGQLSAVAGGVWCGCTVN